MQFLQEGGDATRIYMHQMPSFFATRDVLPQQDHENATCIPCLNEAASQLWASPTGDSRQGAESASSRPLEIVEENSQVQDPVQNDEHQEGQATQPPLPQQPQETVQNEDLEESQATQLLPAQQPLEPQPSTSRYVDKD